MVGIPYSGYSFLRTTQTTSAIDVSSFYPAKWLTEQLLFRYFQGGMLPRNRRVTGCTKQTAKIGKTLLHYEIISSK
jgi:hypothetical protein